MEVYYDTLYTEYRLNLCGKLKHQVSLGSDVFGNLTRIENELSKIPAKLEAAKVRRTETITQMENAKIEVDKLFAFEDELKTKSERLNTLNIELNLDKKEPAALDSEPEQTDKLPARNYTSPSIAIKRGSVFNIERWGTMFNLPSKYPAS